MNKQELAIATISWARDESEEELLRQSLKQLSLLDIPVFVTDGGSSEAFVDFIAGLKNFTVLQPAAKGLWSQTKTSLEHAANSGAPFILYTEPDKLDFFKHLSTLIDNIEVKEDTGIVLASRSQASFGSFPAFQQMTETTINNYCEEVMRKRIDYTYGPFILDKNVIPYLEVLPGDIGWGWRPYTFNIAVRLGLSLEACIGDFTCPTNQQEDDETERLHRMKQLAQNIQGLVMSTIASL